MLYALQPRATAPPTTTRTKTIPAKILKPVLPDTLASSSNDLVGLIVPANCGGVVKGARKDCGKPPPGGATPPPVPVQGDATGSEKTAAGSPWLPGILPTTW